MLRVLDKGKIGDAPAVANPLRGVPVRGQVIEDTLDSR